MPGKASTLKASLQCFIGTSLRTAHYTFDLLFPEVVGVKKCIKNNEDKGS